MAIQVIEQGSADLGVVSRQSFFLEGRESLSSLSLLPGNLHRQANLTGTAFEVKLQARPELPRA
ncbi:hypothetical protein [Verrucomicrobium sp. 3C]|uniref:hypothetical protein n=1 Tax=Verrucomicrobium sp. 3C TaxID=1134055 RepID=UPI000375969F|nr:hypothetical protein [Verrucomicrobium sp. 3C]